MAMPTFILFAGDTLWRVAALSIGQPTFVDVSLAANAEPGDVAGSIADALRGLNYEGQPTLLAIPASWCLAASIQTADLPPGHRNAMLYRLEEKLPVSAEEIIADFVFSDPRATDGGTALGVCVSTKLLQSTVESLEANGVIVQSITPTILAAAQAVMLNSVSRSFVLIAQETDDADAQINVLTIQSGKLASWALLPRNARDLKLHLEMICMEFETPWRCEPMGVDATLLQSVASMFEAPITLRTETTPAAAATFGSAALAGLQRPWIEFRRGPLAIHDRLRQHRQSLNRLLVAAAVLLLISIAVLFARAERYHLLAASLDQQMIDAFRGTFPGWTVPTNIRAVVEAEHRKAATATGESLPADARGSAMQTLHDILSRFPSDGHYSLDRMSFEADSFQIEGRLQSYEQVDALASAARQAGLEVPPAVTRKRDDGFWSFILQGNRPAISSAAVAKGSGG